MKNELLASRNFYHVDLSYPLLEKGYLSIGFSDKVIDEIIDKVKYNDWNYFNQLFQAEWG